MTVLQSSQKSPTRSKFHKSISAVFFAPILAGPLSAAERPNILWITIEDWSPDLSADAGYFTCLISWKTDCNFLPDKKEELFMGVDWKVRKPDASN